MPNTPTHVRLFNLLGAIRAMAPFNTMTVEEDVLLQALFLRWHADGSLKVSDVMHAHDDVSETTTYRRLIALRDKGMVALTTDTADRRVKFVEPTKLAMEYALRLASAVEERFQPRI